MILFHIRQCAVNRWAPKVFRILISVESGNLDFCCRILFTANIICMQSMACLFMSCHTVCLLLIVMFCLLWAPPSCVCHSEVFAVPMMSNGIILAPPPPVFHVKGMCLKYVIYSKHLRNDMTWRYSIVKHQKGLVRCHWAILSVAKLAIANVLTK